MHPFYFGSRDRRLFGIYEPSRLARSRSRAALLCHPWGSEYLHSHKSMRQLAILLAEAGVDSLRFDYYATGDSAGNDAEGDLASWRQDILTAVEELTSLAGVTRVTLVGLRLGATLAAQASGDLGKTVDGLVLWDPVIEGPAYIDELHAICRAQPIAIREPVSRPTSVGGGFEILGFPLTGRIHSELQDLSLAAIAPRIPCPVHAVVSGPESACELVRTVLTPVSPPVVQRIENLPVWLEDWPRNSGVVPAKILQQIVQWVAP
jgi:pimeloyl-ACP methyl ester carboxylesterase